jgi:hypothetical protein
MSGCKKNNDLQIDYPAQGQYGENILDRTNTNYPVGSNSMRVILGDEAKIKIKIKGMKWTFDMNLFRDWEVGEWNYKDTSRIFTSIKTGETDSKISLMLSTKTRIVVYENGDTIPTWSKDITVQ